MVLGLTEQQLREMIHEVNFNQKKVKFIQQCATIIKEDYGGVIPNDYKKVLEFPGVGPKVANLFMQIAYDKLEGISVDTHVHRISNRFRWVKTKTPEQTMTELQKLLPKSIWGEINPLLVGFGQQTCKPLNPLCHTCRLNDICPEG